LVLVRLAVPPVVAVSWRGKVSDVPPVKVAAVPGTEDAGRASLSIAAPPNVGRVKAPYEIRPAPPVTESAPPSVAAGTGWDGPRVKTWLVWAWIGGVVLLAVRVIASSVRLSRAVGRTEVVADGRVIALLEACCAEAGVRRAPGVRSLPARGGPALVGFWRPVILLPPGVVDGMSDGELRLILLHELAHVRRRDVLVNWLGTLVAVVHWPNPAAWWVMARMRFERELACDEFVLHAGRDAAGGADRGAYARTIVRLAEALSVGGGGGEGAGGRVAVPAGAVGGVGIVEGRTQLQRRLQMIARFDAAAAGRRWPAVAMGLGILVGAAALSGATRAADKPVAEKGAAVDPPAEGGPSLPGEGAKPHAAGAAKAGKGAPAGGPNPAVAGPSNPVVPGMPGSVPGAETPGRAKPSQPAAAPVVAADPASARTAEKLKKPATVSFNGQALSDVIDFLRDVTGVDFLVQWNQLEAAGMTREQPVTIGLREPAPVEAVLSLMFRTLPVKLRYEIDKGVVVIGTVEDVVTAAPEVTRVYDVRDLVSVSLNAVAPPGPGLAPGPDGGGGGGGGGGDAALLPAHVEQLIKLITSTIQPESWRDAGGTSGSITAFKGKLVVKATEAAHKEVAQLLEMLREGPGGAAKKKGQ
jgi:hypothetical protein